MKRVLLTFALALLTSPAFAVVPTIVSMYPTGAVPPNMERWFMSVAVLPTTASCRYATSAGVAWASMTNFAIHVNMGGVRIAEGPRYESTLAAGATFQRWVKCRDTDQAETADTLFEAVSDNIATYDGTSAPFLAAQTSGTVYFDLHPASTFTAQRGAWGIPFPRGWLPTADLGKVRLYDGVTEQSVAVSCALVWRNSGNRTEETSCRSVLIQADLTYATTAPKRLSIVWGGSVRGVADIGNPVAARDTWVDVLNQPIGGFPDAAAVQEPRVLAVFSPKWYADCIVRVPFLPKGSHPDFRYYDRVMPFLVDTAMNNVDPRVTNNTTTLNPFHVNPNTTSYETWEYDPPSWILQAGMVGGTYRFLRHGVRMAEFYQGTIGTSGGETGITSIKPTNDVKYSSPDGMLTAMILTGDASFVPTIVLVADVWNNPVTTGTSRLYIVRQSLWTERHWGFGLAANQIAYEATGTDSYGETAQGYVSSAKYMLDNPYTPSTFQRGLVHDGAAHSGDCVGTCISSWMTTIAADSLFRYWLHTEDTRVPDMIVDLAEAITSTAAPAAMIYNYCGNGTSPPQHRCVRVARYVLDPTPVGQGEVDMEHSLDLAALMALGLYFDSDNTVLETAFWDFMRAAEQTGFPWWIRGAAPISGSSHYRLAPYRSGGWRFKPSMHSSYLVGLSKRKPLGLRIATSTNVATAGPGETVTVTMVLTNVGTEQIDDVQLILGWRGLPSPPLVATSMYNHTEGMSFNSCTGTCVNQNQTRWIIGDMAAGATVTKTATYNILTPATTPTTGRDMSPYMFAPYAHHCRFGEGSPTCVPGSTASEHIGTQTVTVIGEAVAVTRENNTSFTGTVPTAASALGVAP